MAPLSRSLSAQVFKGTKSLLNIKALWKKAADEVKRNVHNEKLSVLYLGRNKQASNDQKLQDDTGTVGNKFYDTSDSSVSLEPLKDPGDIGLSQSFRDNGLVGSTRKTLSPESEIIMKNNIQAYYKKRWVAGFDLATSQEKEALSQGFGYTRYNNAVQSENVPSFLPKNMVELHPRESDENSLIHNRKNYINVTSQVTNETLRPQISLELSSLPNTEDSVRQTLLSTNTQETTLTTLQSKETTPAAHQSKENRMNFIEIQGKQTTLSRILEERKQEEIGRLQFHTILYDNSKFLEESQKRNEKILPDFVKAKEGAESVLRRRISLSVDKSKVAEPSKENRRALEDHSKVENEPELKDVKLCEKIKDQTQNDLEGIFLKFKPPIFNFKEEPLKDHGHGMSDQPVEKGIISISNGAMFSQKRGFCSITNPQRKLCANEKSLMNTFKTIFTSKTLLGDPCLPLPLPPTCVPPPCEIPVGKIRHCEIPKPPSWNIPCHRICLPCCIPVKAQKTCKELKDVGRNTCKRITYRIPAFSECDKCLIPKGSTPGKEHYKKECCYHFEKCTENSFLDEIKPMLSIRARQELVLGRVPKTTCDRKFSTSAHHSQKNDEKECKKTDSKLPCVKSTDLSGKKVEKKLSDKKVCEKFCMPCCSPARDPPDCFYPYVKPECKKMKAPRPSYSECKTDFPMKPVIPCECVRPRETSCKQSKEDKSKIC